MKPLVLIIDDSELILQMLDMVCQQAGYRTITCNSFSQVDEVVLDEAPAVVVSDLNLPGLGERDPVAALHAITQLESVPVIIVSGIEAAELEETAERIGAAGAISKDGGMPVVQAELPKLLAELSGS
ncbi:response regulator [Persicimonas caeni]|jgi:CheY-like chemotaxis protein|uniref:Response regulator n=1 Tax=Persicimonas caeni TaxID=2292766 RepID=A0A4Y6PTK6_PERCE|nr:response regulator [Persicimonas caeni]QDG51651.1 response regulator [Persicimonas caeni]QED32872.1 response regulator [Persicimonas caeni]